MSVVVAKAARIRSVQTKISLMESALPKGSAPRFRSVLALVQRYRREFKRQYNAILGFSTRKCRPKICPGFGGRSERVNAAVPEGRRLCSLRTRLGPSYGEAA